MTAHTEDAAPRAGRGAWAEEGVETVAPGVHRVPLPLPGDGLKAVNVYVLVHDDRATLVDGGWSFGPGLQVLERGLAHLDLDLGQVDRVLVTHVHRDHFTLAVRLRELCGARILLGAGERDSLEVLTAGRQDGQRSWLARWGAECLREELDRLPPPDDGRYEAPDEWLDGSSDVRVGDRRLRVVPTPGHTRGHLVFADVEAGLLFSGDHVLPTITPSIGLETARAELPLSDFIDSLHVTQALPDLELLPAHGPVGRRSHERVGELLDHHRRRLAASRAAVDVGGTAFDVARRLPWTRREVAFDDLDVHNRLLAVSETASHLDVLVRDGALEVCSTSGTRTYHHTGGTPCAPR